MKYAAELFGTFALVFAGLGTAVLAGGTVHAVGISFAFGLTLVAMIYTIGPISGCHINPAVTLAMVLTRRMKAAEAAGYMVVQVIGAIIGAGLVLAIAKGNGFIPTPDNFGINGYGAHSPGHYNLLAAFLTEAFFTVLLVITVLGATDEKAPAGFAGLAIGLVLAVTNLASIPVTNASINPARSIGPAIYVRGWAIDQLWLFIVAPLAGGALAAAIYLTLRGAGEERGKAKAAGA
ncbi:MAG TPA: MIP family channel protein [Candidatus Angelobacter sp.]